MRRTFQTASTLMLTASVASACVMHNPMPPVGYDPFGGPGGGDIALVIAGQLFGIGGAPGITLCQCGLNILSSTVAGMTVTGASVVIANNSLIVETLADFPFATDIVTSGDLSVLAGATWFGFSGNVNLPLNPRPLVAGETFALAFGLDTMGNLSPGMTFRFASGSGLGSRGDPDHPLQVFGPITIPEPATAWSALLGFALIAASRAIRR